MSLLNEYTTLKQNIHANMGVLVAFATWILAADALGLLCCRVGPSMIKVIPAHSVDSQSDLHLGSLDTRSMLWALCHVT